MVWSMSKNEQHTTEHSESSIYQIRFKGHLSNQWVEWFAGMTITLEEDGNTLLTGPVIDQAALYGLLRKVRDLGLPLLFVMRIEQAPSDIIDAADEPKISTVV